MSLQISRRGFLTGLGAGLAIAVLPRTGETAPAISTPSSVGGFSPHALVHIAFDGTVTIICHRSEMGQGIRSSLPVLIADELGADPAKILVRQAEGDKKYGDQNTDGSTSIRRPYDNYRKAGAAARQMLISAAATRWRVKPETCVVANHQIAHPPTKRTFDFKDVVQAAAKLPVPKDPKPRPFAELRHVNDPNLPLLDGAAYVTGTASFGADVTLPDMLIAVIARPPVVGGRVAKYDKLKALAVKGVKHVIEMPVATKPWVFQPWGGIAVVADTTWAALAGRAALEITWDHGEHADYSSEAFREELLASVRAPGTAHRNVGDIDTAFASAAKTVEAEYVVPHLSHMQMEPLAALARVNADGSAETWAPTQNPQANRSAIASFLGIGEDKVKCNVTLLGGAFGRKSKSDFVVEAVYLAKQLKVPVRVQWTREDDVKHGYYNAVNAQRLRAALDAKGAVVGWHHRTAFTPIAATFTGMTDTPTEGDLQQGVTDLALAVPNVRAEACKAPAKTRVGWFRSVYNIFHSFAVGSFIDEIAHARGADPLDVWLELIPSGKQSLADLGVGKLPNYGESLDKHPVDGARLRNVITKVAEMAAWKQRKGRFLGLAAHRSFVAYTGVVIAVEPDPQRVFRISEAWIAMDAGTVVNQDRVHSQMEGALVMGISNVLYGGITMKHGVVEQSNFRDARVARIGDVPRVIHTHVVASTAPPSGVGEPGTPPVGAALANALFALTRKRLREVPLAKALKI